MHTYLITGANRGLGLEMCRQLLERGQKVIATCRDPDSAEGLNSMRGNLDIHALDVADERSIIALSEELRTVTVDVLINNAGVMAAEQNIDNMNRQQWMHSFVVNCIAPWQMTVAFHDQLKRSSVPRAITLTSQMGSLERAGSDRAAYRSSKAAANMALRTLAIAWQDKGIPVCMLHPGWVKTDMGGQQADLTIAQSTKDMLEVIDQLTMEHTGRFLDYRGAEIPW